MREEAEKNTPSHTALTAKVFRQLHLFYEEMNSLFFGVIWFFFRQIIKCAF